MNTLESKENNFNNHEQLQFSEPYIHKLRNVYNLIVSLAAVTLPYISEGQNNEKAQHLFETLDSQGNKSFLGNCSTINLSLSDSVTFMRKDYVPGMQQSCYRVMALKWGKDNKQMKDIYFIDPKTKAIYSQLDPNGNSSRDNCLWSEIEKELL